MTDEDLKNVIRECINELRLMPTDGDLNRFEVYVRRISQHFDDALKNVNPNQDFDPSEVDVNLHNGKFYVLLEDITFMFDHPHRNKSIPGQTYATVLKGSLNKHKKSLGFDNVDTEYVDEEGEPYVGIHMRFDYNEDERADEDMQTALMNYSTWAKMVLEAASRLPTRSLKEFAGTQTDFDFEDNEEEMVRKANKSGQIQRSGAVGAKAVVPKAVLKFAKPTDEILDFGSGKFATQAKMLNDQGLNVTAYDFGSNVDDEVHDSNALSRQYDIVYASNVLNVQGSEQMLKNTLDQIHGSLKPGGKFIFNFPMSPRYGAYQDKGKPSQQLNYLKSVVASVFGNSGIADIANVKGQKKVTPVFAIRRR